MFFIKDIFLRSKQILKSQAIPRTGLINISGPQKKALFNLFAYGKTESHGKEMFVSAGKESSPTFLEFDLSVDFFRFRKQVQIRSEDLDKLKGFGFAGHLSTPYALQATKNKIALMKFFISEKKPNYVLINFLKHKNARHYFDIMNALYSLPGTRGILLIAPEDLEKTIGFLAEITTFDKQLKKEPFIKSFKQKPIYKKIVSSKPAQFLRKVFGQPINVDLTKSKKVIISSFAKSEARRMAILCFLSIISSLFLSLSIVSVNDTRVSILSNEVLNAALRSQEQKILGEIYSSDYPADTMASMESLVSDTQDTYGFQTDDFESRMYYVSSPSATFSPMLLPNPLTAPETISASVVSIPYISRYVSYLDIYLLNEPAWDNMNNLGYPVYISRPYADLYLAHLGLTMYSDLTGMTFLSEVNNGSASQLLSFSIAGVILTPETYYSNTLSFYDHLLGDYYVFVSSTLRNLFGGKSVFFELGTQKSETQEVLGSITDFTQNNANYQFHFLERNSNGDFLDGTLTESKQKMFTYFDSPISVFLSLFFCLVFLLFFVAFVFSAHYSNSLLTPQKSRLLDELYLVFSTLTIIFLSVPLSALIFRLLKLHVFQIVRIPLNNPIALLATSFFFLIAYFTLTGSTLLRKLSRPKE